MVAVRVPQALADDLERFCADFSVSRSIVVREAIYRLLEDMSPELSCLQHSDADDCAIWLPRDQLRTTE